ncbi:hypothetical protein BGZ82_003631 [Podila clonocystis]|nr:hypothetical protein BGZ82_003631 [Podila clonocystis]
MKLLTIALACVVASSSAIVTRDLPFIKMMDMPEKYKDFQEPYEVRNLTSVQFVKVTIAPCAKSTGFMMIEQRPQRY